MVKPASILRHLRGLLGREAGGPGDDELLDRFARRRDAVAFAGLVERHGPLVWAACRRVLPNEHDAEDAFQTTFLVLVRKAEALERGRPLGHWLYKVAVNTALKVRDAAGRLRPLPIDEPPAAPAAAIVEPSRLLDVELNGLPERYRLPLVLCYLESKTHEQAAAELGWPLGSVKGRLARGRELLRTRLERRGIALSGAALTVLLADEAGAAPAGLVETTIRTGLDPTAHARLHPLAEEVMKTLLTTRARSAVVILGVLAVVAGSAVALNQRPAAPPARSGTEELAAVVPIVPSPEKPEVVDRPALAMAWKQGLLELPDEQRKAVLKLLEQDKLALPASTPLFADTVVVYRDCRLVNAAYAPGKPSWNAMTYGGEITRNQGRWLQVQDWLALHAKDKTLGSFQRQTLTGLLSHDGECVYYVDDLPVHPPTILARFKLYGPLRDQVRENALVAIDKATGKLRWVLSSRYDQNCPLAGSHFLGPPLCHNGLLYTLSEKDSEIWLSCLQSGEQPQVLWSTKLLQLGTPLTQDLVRHAQAALIGQGNDVLVCPTNAGLLVAVDRKTHEVLWTFRYRLPGAGSFCWEPTAPVVDGDKVIFAPADGDTIHCLRLREGKELWRAPRGDGLYLAGVHEHKAVLVGVDSCRALDVDSGRLAWHNRPGRPSGRGVMHNQVYYLPLRAGIRSKQPEICLFDPARGTVLARYPLEDGKVPGNLAVGPKQIYAQTVTEVIAYPLPGK